MGWTGSNNLILTSEYTLDGPYVAKYRDHYFGTDFSVSEGERYRVFVTAKRTAGDINMQGGIWYTEYTSGTPSEGWNGEFVKYEELEDGWARYYKDVTVPAGKTKGVFYIQLNQYSPYGTIWQLTDMHIISTDLTTTIPSGSFGDKTFVANWKEL